MDMLQQIEQGLAAALAAVTMREEALASAHLPTDEEHEAAWARLLQQVERSCLPDESSARPSEQLPAAEEALASAHAALDAWLAKAGQAAQRLAEQAGRAV
jgi:hypothetical protein